MGILLQVDYMQRPIVGKILSTNSVYDNYMEISHDVYYDNPLDLISNYLDQGWSFSLIQQIDMHYWECQFEISSSKNQFSDNKSTSSTRPITTRLVLPDKLEARPLQ